MQSTGSVDLDGVIERMMQHGSTITRADVLGVLEGYYDVLTQLLLEGKTVTTPVTNYAVSIRGNFDDASDSYDGSRHQVRASTSTGKRLRAAVKGRATVKKQESVHLAPHPVSYTDYNSGQRDRTLTPGGMGKLTGHRLKFDPHGADQGIFLLDSRGGETRVAVVGKIFPSSLVFLVPSRLVADAYRVEVRASVNGNGEIRGGVLKGPLVVG